MRFESIGMGKPVSFGDLPNGLRYYGRFDQVANAGGIGVRSGSMHGPRGKTGLPHFVEHAVCRISRKHSGKEASLLWRRYLGGGDDEANVRIDRYSTFFGNLMLLRLSHMRSCFDMFSHMLKDRLFDSEGVAIERSRIKNEYCLRGTDIMDEVLWDELHAMAYSHNPARHRIDCIPEELDTISIRELLSFTNRHYVARNMFVIVLGPRFKVAERLARQYFEDWPDCPVPKLDYNMTDGYAPLKVTQIRKLTRPGIGQHHVMIGFPVEEFGGKHHYALKVLIHILEHLLSEEIQEHARGVYRSPVVLSQSKFHGLLTINFATIHPEFVDSAVGSVSNLCRRLKENLVDLEVFSSTMHRAFYEWVGPFVNDASELVESITKSTANGDEDLTILHSGRTELGKVNRRKIVEIANQFLTPEFLMVHITPA